MGKHLTEGDRQTLSNLLTELFELWGVTAEEQLELMGYPDGSRVSELRRLRQGKPFPDNDDMLFRVEQILAIHDCLRTAYPRSVNMAKYWLHQSNRRLGRRTPISVMLQGAGGLREVRTHLDCTQNWI